MFLRDFQNWTLRYCGGNYFVKETTLRKMWDEFSVLPKVEVPETGRAGNILYRKISDIFFEDEMHSELESIAWSPLNPNPVTLRKFLMFQG